MSTSSPRYRTRLPQLLGDLLGKYFPGTQTLNTNLQSETTPKIDDGNDISGRKVVYRRKKKNTIISVSNRSANKNLKIPSSIILVTFVNEVCIGYRKYNNFTEIIIKKLNPMFSRFVFTRNILIS